MANLTRSLQAFASAARTATVNSSDLKNNQFVGCHAVIDMSAITATGSVVFKIQALDALSGKYYDIIESAAVTTVSTVVLRVYPSLTAVANLTVNDALPMDFRVVATHLNAMAMTYEVNCNMIL